MRTTATTDLITFFFFFFLLFSLSSSTISPEDNISVATTVHDLLPEYGLPKGLLPKSVDSYSLADDGSFVVTLVAPCYVKFGEDLVYYDTTVKGTLTYGSIGNLSGIQAKKLFVWVSVTSMEADLVNNVIEFHVGFLTKNLPVKMFDKIPVCQNQVRGIVLEADSSGVPCRGNGMGVFLLPVYSVSEVWSPFFLLPFVFFSFWLVVGSGIVLLAVVFRSRVKRNWF